MEFITDLKKPVAFVHSENDEYGKLENVRSLLGRMSAPHELFVVAGADHLCTGKLDEFSRAAKQAVDWLLST